ncbi:unnamed protein product, partial [Brenthis ino]
MRRRPSYSAATVLYASGVSPPHLSREHIPKDVKIRQREKFNNLCDSQRSILGRNLRQTLQSARAENAKVARLCPDVRQSSPRPTTSIPMPNRIIDYLAPESPMDADDDLLIELLFKM